MWAALNSETPWLNSQPCLGKLLNIRQVSDLALSCG